jgi:CAAX protease family protein
VRGVNLPRVSDTRQLLTFFAIAFAYTWAVAACMIAWHIRIEFTILASAGPLVAATITSRFASGRYRAFRFNVDWRRTAAAAALGIALVLIFEIALPATAVADASRLGWGIFVSPAAYNYSTLLGGPLFEEPGWRGFALPRLESRLGPLAGTLILGLAWSAWHLPFFWYPGWNSIPIWNYFLIVTAFAVLLTWATNVARFGVIAAILMHAAHNTSGRYFDGLFAGANPGSGGFIPAVVGYLSRVAGIHLNVSLSFGELVALGAWTGALVVIAVTKGRLGYPGESARQRLEFAVRTRYASPP